MMILDSKSLKIKKYPRGGSLWRRLVASIVLVTFCSLLSAPVVAQIKLDAAKPMDAKVNKEKDGISKSKLVNQKLAKEIEYTPAARPSIRSLGTKELLLERNSKQPPSNIFSSTKKYQPYFELGGAKFFNQSSNVAGIYDLFIPLLQNDGQLFFTDLRIFDRSGSSFEGNAHLGYRKIDLNRKQMFGVYAAYDYKRSENRNGFNQVTLGAEYWHDKWFVGGNIYKPLGWTKKISKIDSQKDKITGRSIPNAKHYERALGGFDAEVGHAFNRSLTGYVGGYYFHSIDMGTISGPKARLTYDYQKQHGRILGVLDGVSIELGAQHDKPRGATAYIGIKLKLGLSSRDKNTNLSGFERHMTELVRRDPDIVIGEHKIELANEQGYMKGSPRRDHDQKNGKKAEETRDWSEATIDELLEEFDFTAGDISLRDVKKMFNARCLKNHPDKKGSEDAFMKDKEIRDVLVQKLGKTKRYSFKGGAKKPQMHPESHFKGDGYSNSQRDDYSRGSFNGEVYNNSKPEQKAGEQEPRANMQGQKESEQEQKESRHDPKRLSNNFLFAIDDFESGNYNKTSQEQKTASRTGELIFTSSEQTFKDNSVYEQTPCTSSRIGGEARQKNQTLINTYVEGQGISFINRVRQVGQIVVPAVRWVGSTADYIYDILVPIKMANAEYLVLPHQEVEGGDLNLMLNRLVDKRASSRDALIEVLHTIVAGNISHQLNVRSISKLQGILSNQSYDEILQQYVIYILTEHAVYYSKDSTEMIFLVNLLSDKKIDTMIKDVIINRFTDYVGTKSLWDDPDRDQVLDSFPLLFSFDKKLKQFSEKLVAGMVYAYERRRYLVKDLDMLPYFENLLDNPEYRDRVGPILSESLASALLFHDTNTSISKIKEHIEVLLDKLDGLSFSLVAQVLDSYVVHQDDLESLVVDIVAKDKRLSSDLLNKLINSLDHIKKPLIALFIALRIQQHDSSLILYKNPELLVELVHFLYSKDERVRNAAINFYSLVEKIPEVYRDRLVDGLIYSLAGTSSIQRNKIKAIFNKIDLSKEQKSRIQIQRQISEASEKSVEDRAVFAEQLSREISDKNKKELSIFFKSSLVSQNIKLLEVIKDHLNELSKILDLSFSHEEQELVKLLKVMNSWWKEHVFMKFIKLHFASSSFLLAPKQWKNLKNKLRDVSWLKKQLDKIEFRTFVEVTKFVDFVVANKIREDQVSKAITRYAWQPKVLQIYQTLLGDLIRDIQKIDNLALSDKKELSQSVDELLLEAGWDEEIILNLIIGTNSKDFSDLISILGILADYKISPEALDRSGQSVLDILQQQLPCKQLVPSIMRLVRDGRLFVAKDIHILLQEIDESNRKIAPWVSELVQDGTLLNEFNKIEAIKNDWAGSRYVLISSPAKPDICAPNTIYVYEQVVVGNDQDKDEDHDSIESQICFAIEDQEKCISTVNLSNEELEEYKAFLGNKDIDPTFIYEWVIRLDLAPNLKGIAKRLLDWSDSDFKKWRKTIRKVELGVNAEEVIAVLSQVAYNTVLNKKFYPRPIQLLALLLKLRRVVVSQIATGEGKSLIIGMSTAIKVLNAGTPDIVTSSKVLAKRDAVDYEKFYKVLDIESGNNVDPGEDGLSKEVYKKPVVYGDVMSFAGDTLWDITDNIKLGRGFCSITVDEIDNLFIDKNGYKIQLSKPMPGFDALTQVLIYLWGGERLFRSRLYQSDEQCYFVVPEKEVDEYEEEKRGWYKEHYTELTIEAEKYYGLPEGTDCSKTLDKSIEDFAINQLFAFDHAREKRQFVVPQDKEGFVKDQLDHWLRSLRLAKSVYREDVEYIVDKSPIDKLDGIVPIDVSTGELQYNLKWSDGLHQFLQLKHSVVLHPESLVTVFISYPGFFNKYIFNIDGVTGTLGSEIHIDYLYQSFGIESIIIPTFVKKDLVILSNILVDDEQEWQQDIVNDVKRTILKRNRSGLVVMETVAQVEALYKLLQSLEQDYDIHLFTYGLGASSDISNFDVNDELQPGTVIIATNLAGRGTDLSLSPEVLKNGGLHVILTMFPNDVRIEDQVFGRAGRKGEPGSVRQIVNLKHLNTECQDFACLNIERAKGSEEHLKSCTEKRLPQLKVLDNLFNKYADFIRYFDSPTGNHLLIGKPEEHQEIEPYSLFIFKDDEQIILKNIMGRDEEDEYQDITELISAIDPYVKSHLDLILSNSKSVASSLSKQDYEVINFIGAKLGYAKNPKVYNTIYNLFIDQVSGFRVVDNGLPWQATDDLRTRRFIREKSAYLERLLQKDHTFKDLRKDNKSFDEKLAGQIEARKLFLLWAEYRKIHNKNFDIKQLDENWGIWLRKQIDPLIKYAYQDTEADSTKLALLEEQLNNDFHDFAQKMLDPELQKNFIKNPAYLVLKGWHSLTFDINSAVRYFEDASGRDKFYSWKAYNALANGKMMRDGAGIHEENEENIARANQIKNDYYNSMQAAISNLNLEIDRIGQLVSILALTYGVSDETPIYRQLVGTMEVYRVIIKKMEANADLILNSKSNEMIRGKNVIDLDKATKKIDLAAAIMKERVKQNKSTDLVSKESMRNDKDIKKIDFQSRQLIVDQIGASGGVIIELETYELEKPPKNWFGTILSAVMGIGFIILGVILAPIGGVFLGVLATSLVAKGIGDIVSSLMSVILGNPIDALGYLKSSAISLAIAIVTAGFLHFVDSMVTNGIQALDSVAGRGRDTLGHISAVNEAGETIKSSLANDALSYIGKASARQAAFTVGAMGAYEFGRKTIKQEDIREEAAKAIDDVISNQKELLREIFANGLLGTLNRKIGNIVNEYLNKFQDTGTKIGIGTATSAAGYLLDALPSPIGIGGALNTAVDTSFGMVKYSRALPDIVSDTKKAIEEVWKMRAGSGAMFEDKLIDNFKTGGDGEKLVSALKTQGFLFKDRSGTWEINYQECDNLVEVNINGIKFSNDLGSKGFDYRNGMKETCEDIKWIMTFEYDGQYSSFKESFVNLASGAIKHIGTQEVVDPALKGVTQMIGNPIANMIEERIKESQNSLNKEAVTVDPIVQEDKVGDVLRKGVATQKEADLQNAKSSPDSLQTVEIKPGSTLSEIAADLSKDIGRKVTVNELVELNNLKNPNFVRGGDLLLVLVGSSNDFSIRGDAFGKAYRDLAEGDSLFSNTCELPVKGSIFDDFGLLLPIDIQSSESKDYSLEDPKKHEQSYINVKDNQDSADNAKSESYFSVNLGNEENVFSDIGDNHFGFNNDPGVNRYCSNGFCVDVDRNLGVRPVTIIDLPEQIKDHLTSELYNYLGYCKTTGTFFDSGFGGDVDFKVQRFSYGGNANGWETRSRGVVGTISDPNLDIRLAGEAAYLAYPDEISIHGKDEKVMDAKYQKTIDESGYFKMLQSKGYKFIDHIDKAGISNYFSKEYGHYAVALEAPNGDIIISNQGSRMINLGDVKNMINIIEGQTMGQHNSAKSFAAKIIDQHPNSKTIFTGHSAGGVLSQMLAAEFGKEAIVFESPGAKRQIDILKKNNLISKNYNPSKIKIINALPNFINTYGEHVNTPIVILNNPKGKICLEASCNVKGIIPPKVGIPADYWHNHGITPILDNMYNDGSFAQIPVKSWPRDSLPFYSTIEAYNAMPDIYDSYIHQLWKDQHSKNYFNEYAFLKKPVLYGYKNRLMENIKGVNSLLSEVNFRAIYPTFESYRNDYIKYGFSDNHDRKN